MKKKENVDLDVVTNKNFPQQNVLPNTLEVSESQNISNTTIGTIPSNDPIEWLPNKCHQKFIAHNGFIQNIDVDFMNSAKIYGNTTIGTAQGAHFTDKHVMENKFKENG